MNTEPKILDTINLQPDLPRDPKASYVMSDGVLSGIEQGLDMKTTALPMLHAGKLTVGVFLDSELDPGLGNPIETFQKYFPNFSPDMLAEVADRLKEGAG